MKKTLLVTGSCGLIGSQAVISLSSKYDQVIGLDNNQRMDFFGPSGDTSKVRQDLEHEVKSYQHFDTDIRDRKAILEIFDKYKPVSIVHCAAQPAHDLGAKRPFDDFDINAGGTLNLLEAARISTPESPFVFLSTNKVYGDRPNFLPLKELETRYDFEHDHFGISESMPVDQTLHSIFGASKVSADILVQEYGRYFGMPTVCFRGGCLTGARHKGVELHGFLSYMVKTAVLGNVYRIIGHKGKQVRDQIDAKDVIAAAEAFIENPRAGEVYNIGGGRNNSASLLECISKIESKLSKSMQTVYVDEPRVGDHICYISDTRKFMSHYPRWDITISIDEIIDSIIKSEQIHSL